MGVLLGLLCTANKLTFMGFCCLVGWLVLSGRIDHVKENWRIHLLSNIYLLVLHTLLRGSDIAVVWGQSQFLCNVFATLELLRAGRLIPAHKLEAHLQTDCQTFIY